MCKTHINSEPPHKFGFLYPCWKLIHDNVDDKLLNNIITIPADITMVRPLLSLNRGGARVTLSPHIPGTLGRFQWELNISINLSSFWHRQPRTDYGLRPCATYKNYKAELLLRINNSKRLQSDEHMIPRTTFLVFGFIFIIFFVQQGIDQNYTSIPISEKSIPKFANRYNF